MDAVIALVLFCCAGFIVWANIKGAPARNARKEKKK